MYNIEFVCVSGAQCWYELSVSISFR